MPKSLSWKRVGMLPDPLLYAYLGGAGKVSRVTERFRRVD